MDLTHIEAFTTAMARKDVAAMLTHMTETVVLRTPLAAEPVVGKPAIRAVVDALFRVVDGLEFQEIMSGPRHVSSFFKVTAGPHALDGMDYWRLDASGLIAEMTVLWRPLPVVAAVQRMLAGESA